MTKKILFFAAIALTLFACGEHSLQEFNTLSSSSDDTSSSSVDEPSSSSGDGTSSSSDNLSSSSGDDGNSSSSAEPLPKCGEAEYDPVTHFCQAGTDEALPLCNGQEYSNSYFCQNGKLLGNENCKDFKNGTTRQHYGKNKPQFCDVRDGYKYVYADIGSQTWMAENLRYSGEEGKLIGRSICVDGDCDIYGRQYSLNEMFCSSGCDELRWGVSNPEDQSINIACPIGWHLPSTTEYEALWTYSDPNFVPGSEGSGQGRNSAATKLKAIGWGDGTDELGFSGLPGGYKGGTDLGSRSFWWSHAYGAPVPLGKSLRMSTSAVVDDAFQSDHTSTFYVRCLKDKTASPKTPEPAPQTLACSGTGPRGYRCHYGKWKDYFKDTRDNKEYPYAEIGGKIWMAANLDYNAESSVCYNGLNANCDTYGRLYNYATAVNACPSGWHLPTDAEWTALTTAVNNGLAGTAAKLKAKSGWSNSRSTNGTLGTDGTDDYGFSALPGSYGNLRAGNYGSIINFGSARGSFWWSSTPQAANGARIRHIGPTLGNVTGVDNDKSRLYSVRCVLN